MKMLFVVMVWTGERHELVGVCDDAERAEDMMIRDAELGQYRGLVDYSIYAQLPNTLFTNAAKVR